MTVQHYVTGNGDDSLSKLGDLYGVSWKSIGNANYPSWGASYMYPWLRDNGGIRRASANVPTGGRRNGAGSIALGGTPAKPPAPKIPRWLK